MAHVTFSEEPESLGPKDGTESSGRTAQQWDEDRWAGDILRQECIRNGKNDLDKRVLEFLAVASAEERELLQTSRQQVLDIIDVAKTEQTKHRAAVPSSIIPSLANRVKRTWSATSEVAYEYVQMLDVMVSQAPEYIALAYGAIKILLVVQVNYEELKRKVEQHLKHILLQFNLIDHLTAYVPTSNIVIGVAQAYSLFYRFLAKAVKYYTQSRLSESCVSTERRLDDNKKMLETYLKALTKPWRRFQDLVDSIEQTLSNVKDAANYHGFIENHINMVVSRKNLVISEANSSKLERTLELIQDLHSKVHAISIRFSKESDIRQTADALRQQTEEKLEEPVLSKVHPSAELEPDFDVTAAAGQAYLDTPDDLRNTLFAELRQADEVDARKKRAIEELPGMWAHRSENRNFMKSEKAAAWVESNKSQLLWIDGNHILSRTDFNASFAFPLILLGESRYESVLILRYFCQDNTGSTDQYLVMMQALLHGLFEQHPSIFKRRIESITRDQTSQTSNLWDLFLECLGEVRTQCVFILIGGIDHLVETRNPAQDTREDIVRRFQTLMDNSKTLIKILLTISITQPPAVTIGASSSLVGFRSHQNSKRTLSFDSVHNDLPLFTRQLVEFQEKRCKSAKFTDLPMLYPPGSLIYLLDGGQLQAFVVSELSGMNAQPFGGFGPLHIRAWAVDHNRVYFCKRYYDFKVPQFIGQRDITHLKYLPAGYVPEEAFRRREMIKRGRQYWSLGSSVHYVQIKRKKGLSRVIIDQTRHPVDPSLLEQYTDQFPPTSETNIKPRFLLLCPPNVSIYDISEMEWKTTNLESVQPMDYDPHPFESLVIDEKIKDLLQATIEPLSKPSLTQQPEYQRDTAGQSGLVILLHGAPGTGKSMTAQCLADYTKRPLLSLRIEKIGVAATDIQEHLTEAFQLAEHWDGIIFIDHADVLLEERATTDLARNSIVTVLLRALDYYQGILVLATNRLGTFDEAFKSRMHLSFSYGKLIPAVRRQIWAKIFTQLRRTDGPNIDVEDLISRLPVLEDCNMNGREIHNAISTARQLSQFKGSKLNFKYLRDAITVGGRFVGYLPKSTGGLEDE